MELSLEQQKMVIRVLMNSLLPNIFQMLDFDVELDHDSLGMTATYGHHTIDKHNFDKMFEDIKCIHKHQIVVKTDITEHTDRRMQMMKDLFGMAPPKKELTVVFERPGLPHYTFSRNVTELNIGGVADIMIALQRFSHDIRLSATSH